MGVGQFVHFLFVFIYLLMSFISGVDVTLEKSRLSELIIRLPYDTSFEFETNPIRRDLYFAVLMPVEYCEDAPKAISKTILPAIEMGVRHIQQKGFLLKNVNVTIIFRDTQCSSTYGPIGFFEIYNKYKVISSVFGFASNYALAPTARFASVWEIPVFTTIGRATAFDVKSSLYPTLYRMMGSFTIFGRAIKSIFDTFNWTSCYILYQNDDRKSKGNSNCMLAASGIHDNILNVEVMRFDGNIDQKNSTILLNGVKNKARIVIMCGNRPSIRQIMLVAEELNMIDSGEYVFFNIELFASSPKYVAKPWYDEHDTEENNRRAKKAYTSVLTVTAKQPDDEKYLAFSDEVKQMAASKYNYTFPTDEPVSPFVTAFYDAVLLYGYALNDTIRDDPDALTKPFNGTELVHRMWNRTFNGITGNVTIDANGDRISAYSLLDMNPDTGRFEIVAHYFYNHLEYVKDKSIHWAGGRLEAPPDKPICGFDGSLCPDNSLPGYAILSLVLGFTVVLMAIISFFGYRHYKSEAEINSMTWKISWHEVMPCDSGTKYRGSMHSLAKRGSQMTLYSEDMGSLGGDRQLFIPIGFYKGCKVAIKKIDENNINLNRSLMLELKRMKDLQHDHLVKFFGACLDPPKCCIFTEYCPKGSLQDILENEQINLDWMFKLSLMHDIVRGMHFLHQSDIKSHGNLKSSNCVVDSRFVLKITDFGLHALRKPNFEDDIENCNSYAYWKRLLWTAPELLRMVNPSPEGTQKADVYSFGIIVHEITTRQGPFFIGSDNKSPEQIVQLVKNYPKGLSQPFRPQIDDSTLTFDDINNIMVKCWAEDPYERPEFGCLKTTIRKINKDNETGNIVDNLLQRMEQYANNLEGLVEERTRDYLEEKKKCEKLLYQLLPESVAAQLICGQPVIAETYDQVTIYFSDIVGFTAISAESTPMEVVSFLNDLYTCFDSIVENFDVYKVETIGDAYMVVSGLPVRNGNLHAREIARMAIALLNAVKKFTIRHRPNDQLKLRIGLHSGPCVAGVVGLKMPRYCLFGDTVNTASRMESNGEALKIHISQSTKDFLDKFHIFDITKRGYVKMKGKGDMLTYWLNGERQTNTIVNNCNSFKIGDDDDIDSPTTILNTNSPTVISTTTTTHNLNSDFKTDEIGEVLNNEQKTTLLTNNGGAPNVIPNQSNCINTNTCSSSNCNLNNISNNDCNNQNNDLIKRNSSSINFNNIVKTNNLKNLKIMCNANEDNVKSVTQPLLAKINS